jgi:hypothetical protein
MTCSRGAASPDKQTQRRLFAASAGYCQNPQCSRELFIDYPDKSINVAEMAHIFAARDEGPRGNAALSKKERGAFENLIMLCSLCHTIVDKVPSAYPDHLMLKWKRTHAEKLRSLFGVTYFHQRSHARAAIEGPLRENSQIFTIMGRILMKQETRRAVRPSAGGERSSKR